MRLNTYWEDASFPIVKICWRQVACADSDVVFEDVIILKEEGQSRFRYLSAKETAGCLVSQIGCGKMFASPLTWRLYC